MSEMIDIDPEIKIIVASGYSDDNVSKEAINAGARAVISKPFDISSVINSIRETLDGTVEQENGQ